MLGISKDVASFYATGFLFFFELAYLVAGYWGRKDLDSLGTPYDWTTPHCVLCLRFVLEFLYETYCNWIYVSTLSKINKVLKITIYFASRLIGLAMDAYDGHRLAQGNKTW